MPDLEKINGRMSQGLGGKNNGGASIEEIDEIRDIQKEQTESIKLINDQLAQVN